MPTLCLLRHARAAHPSRGQQDFDRRLTERGRGEAAGIAPVLAGLAPDLALVSAAARTCETWEIASCDIQPSPRLSIESDLYLGGAEELLARLRAISDAVASVVVVSHNPGLHELAMWLGGGSAGPDLTEMRRKFPTAALAVFTVEPGWAKLTPGRANLSRFLAPE
jgi:phosphohistidine phosphatase